MTLIEFPQSILQYYKADFKKSIFSPNHSRETLFFPGEIMAQKVMETKLWKV